MSFPTSNIQPQPQHRARTNLNALAQGLLAQGGQRQVQALGRGLALGERKYAYGVNSTSNSNLNSDADVGSKVRRREIHGNKVRPGAGRRSGSRTRCRPRSQDRPRPRAGSRPLPQARAESRAGFRAEPRPHPLLQDDDVTVDDNTTHNSSGSGCIEDYEYTGLEYDERSYKPDCSQMDVDDQDDEDDCDPDDDEDEIDEEEHGDQDEDEDEESDDDKDPLALSPPRRTRSDRKTTRIPPPPALPSHRPGHGHGPRPSVTEFDLSNSFTKGIAPGDTSSPQPVRSRQRPAKLNVRGYRKGYGNLHGSHDDEDDEEEESEVEWKEPEAGSDTADDDDDDEEEADWTLTAPLREYERGRLLYPKDGRGGRIPPKYKIEVRLGQDASKTTKAKANKYLGNKNLRYLRLEGKDACTECQKAAKEGWTKGAGEYIGCWVLVPLDWKQGDLVPTYAKGGCGECRGRGKGSRPKDKGGCNLNHASYYGPCHRPQKAKKSSRRVDSPGPVRRQHRERSTPYDRPRVPSSNAQSDHLARTRDLYETCLGDKDDVAAHDELRGAVSTTRIEGWTGIAEREAWYGKMCAYLDRRYRDGQR